MLEMNTGLTSESLSQQSIAAGISLEDLFNAIELALVNN
jgi:hypothetical protein